MRSVVKIFIFLFIFAGFQTARANWVKQNSNTLAHLLDVYFLDNKKGWIAGSDGTLLSTPDGGANWTKNKKFTGDSIRQVYFENDLTGWLLCERSVYELGTNAPSYLLKTVDGGETWEQINFKDNRRARVTKIFFTKNGTGLAIGEGGVFFTMPETEKDWKKLPAPVRYLLYDGKFYDESGGVIVGGGGTILFTEDAGISWNKANILSKIETRLNSVFFINRTNGWTVGTNGTVLQTFNGGKTWREQNSKTKQDLTDVFFRNTAEGWAIGGGGTILHTTTAGNVWTLIESTGKHKLEKISFAGNKGFVVGFGGTILRYDADNKNFLKTPKLQNRN